MNKQQGDSEISENPVSNPREMLKEDVQCKRKNFKTILPEQKLLTLWVVPSYKFWYKSFCKRFWKINKFN